MKIEGDGGDGRRRRGERTRATTIRNKGRKRERMKMEERRTNKDSSGRENENENDMAGLVAFCCSIYKRKRKEAPRPSRFGTRMTSTGTLDDLKRSLHAHFLYTPPSPHTPPSHDDSTLLCAGTSLAHPLQLISPPAASSAPASLTSQRLTTSSPPPKPGGSSTTCQTSTPPSTPTSSSPQSASIHVGPGDGTK